MRPAPSNVTPIVTPPPARKLRGVTRGKIDSPPRLLVYGPEGIGKSTFGGDAPNPIFLGSENGTEQLDVYRMPEPTHWRDAPLTETEDGPVRRDCFNLLEDLIQDQTHDRQTLVIDTIDWIEPLVHKWVCANSRNAKSGKLEPVENLNLAFGGYGNGYKVAIDEFRAWISMLERLRTDRRMAIVILGHAEAVSFRNPEGEDYDTWGLKIHKAASAVFREWCDAVFFVKTDVLAAEKSTGGFQGKKSRFAVGSNVRLLYTQRRPSWYAKSRYNMPEEMPLDYETVAAAIKAHAPASVTEIVAKINEAAGLVAADIQAEIPAALARCAGDPDKLVKLLNWVQAQTDDSNVTQPQPAAPAATEGTQS